MTRPNRLPWPMLALTLLLLAGCETNPDGPSSPPASAGSAAAGTESELAPPKGERVKVDSGPASEK